MKEEELEKLEFEIKVLHRISKLEHKEEKRQDKIAEQERRVMEEVKKIEAIVSGELKRESQRGIDKKAVERMVKRLAIVEEAVRKSGHCKLRD